MGLRERITRIEARIGTSEPPTEEVLAWARLFAASRNRYREDSRDQDPTESDIDAARRFVWGCYANGEKPSLAVIAKSIRHGCQRKEF